MYLKASVIEHSVSEWDSHALFTPRNDEHRRFFVDYCKLKTMAINDLYHLPRVDKFIDSLGDAKVSKTLDACNSYLKVSIAAITCHKTSFVLHTGTHQYISSTPATYQHPFYMVLTKFKWKTCSVYIYNFIIFPN